MWNTSLPVRGDMRIWREDIDLQGNVRCRRCGSCFPSPSRAAMLLTAGYCEVCEEVEDYEARTRVRCTPQEEISLPPCEVDSECYQVRPVFKQCRLDNVFRQCMQPICSIVMWSDKCMALYICDSEKERHDTQKEAANFGALKEGGLGSRRAAHEEEMV